MLLLLVCSINSYCLLRGPEKLAKALTRQSPKALFQFALCGHSETGREQISSHSNSSYLKKKPVGVWHCAKPQSSLQDKLGEECLRASNPLALLILESWPFGVHFFHINYCLQKFQRLLEGKHSNNWKEPGHRNKDKLKWNPISSIFLLYNMMKLWNYSTMKYIMKFS